MLARSEKSPKQTKEVIEVEAKEEDREWNTQKPKGKEGKSAFLNSRRPISRKRLCAVLTIYKLTFYLGIGLKFV